MAGKRNVAYVTQEEPSFVKQFKQRIGYKEDPGVDAKRRAPPGDYCDEDDDDDDERPEREEEKPQVVVLKSGDLTEEEADKLKAGAKDDTDAAVSDQKFVFKKPTKRSTEEEATSVFKSNTSKRIKTSSDSDSCKSKADKKPANSKLLSFSSQEDDEDD